MSGLIPNASSGACGVIATTLFYSATNCELTKSILIPALGLGLVEAGHKYHSEITHMTGLSLVFASAVAIPAIVTRNVVYSILEGQIQSAEAMATLFGYAVAYRTGEALVNWMARQVVEASGIVG